MSDPGSTTTVWREAAAIVGRYPAATLIPGAVLGAIAEAPHYFAGERLIIGNVLTYATAALAYYMYLAFAEEIVVEYSARPNASPCATCFGNCGRRRSTSGVR